MSIQHVRVVVVGGGIAGLTCLHALRSAGLPSLLLEKEAEVGGVWSPAGHPAVYEGLRLNTSAGISMIEPDKDFANRWQDRCPPHDDYVSHIADFVQRRGLREAIIVDTQVMQITGQGQYRFQVLARHRPTGERRQFVAEHIVSASGGQNVPFVPPILGAGSRDAAHLHSCEAFRNPCIFQG